MLETKLSIETRIPFSKTNVAFDDIVPPPPTSSHSAVNDTPKKKKSIYIRKDESFEIIIKIDSKKRSWYKRLFYPKVDETRSISLLRRNYDRYPDFYFKSNTTMSVQKYSYFSSKVTLNIRGFEFFASVLGVYSKDLDNGWKLVRCQKKFTVKPVNKNCFHMLILPGPGCTFNVSTHVVNSEKIVEPYVIAFKDNVTNELVGDKYWFYMKTFYV